VKIKPITESITKGIFLFFIPVTIPMIEAITNAIPNAIPHHSIIFIGKYPYPN
jgi:hypothetical protein